MLDIPVVEFPQILNSTMTPSKLNQARVADLHTTMSGYVERGDKIHVDGIGMQTVDGKEPMYLHALRAHDARQ